MWALFRILVWHDRKAFITQRQVFQVVVPVSVIKTVVEEICYMTAKCVIDYMFQVVCIQYIMNILLYFWCM